MLLTTQEDFLPVWVSIENNMLGSKTAFIGTVVISGFTKFNSLDVYQDPRNDNSFVGELKDYIDEKSIYPFFLYEKNAKSIDDITSEHNAQLSHQYVLNQIALNLIDNGIMIIDQKLPKTQDHIFTVLKKKRDIMFLYDNDSEDRNCMAAVIPYLDENQIQIIKKKECEKPKNLQNNSEEEFEFDIYGNGEKNQEEDNPNFLDLTLIPEGDFNGGLDFINKKEDEMVDDIEIIEKKKDSDIEVVEKNGKDDDLDIEFEENSIKEITDAKEIKRINDMKNMEKKKAEEMKKMEKVENMEKEKVKEIKEKEVKKETISIENKKLIIDLIRSFKIEKKTI
jgi:hypothetical protein